MEQWDPRRRWTVVKIKTHANESKYKFRNWNVKGYVAKVAEINEILDSRKIDFAVLSKTKKKESGTAESGNYIVIYAWSTKNRNSLSRSYVIYPQYTSRKYRLLQCIQRKSNFKDFLTVIGIYAAVEGEEEMSEEFYEYLQKAAQAVNQKDKLVIAVDLNA